MAFTATPPAGRTPYGRFATGLGVGGAFLLGAGLARWGSRAELQALPPPAWSAPALVLGVWACIGAAAFAAGRAPFELARGQAGASGRPAWNRVSVVGSVGVFTLLYAGLAAFDPGGGVALAPHMLGALGVLGLFLAGLALYQHRRALGFGHRVFWGAGVHGVLEGEVLVHTVRYVNRSRTYDAQVKDKDGSTRWVEKTESWIEASSAVEAPATATVRCGAEVRQVALADVTWAAPPRFAPRDGKAAAVVVTRIAAGDDVWLAGPGLFGAPRGARAALLRVVLGHVGRTLLLLAPALLAIGLAAHLAR